MVIAIKQGESPDKFIFEVIDVASAEGGTIEIKGSYERRQWWDRNLSMYKEQEGITFELEVVSRVIPQLCWRERFRQIQGIAALPRDEYLQLINSLECPSHFANAATGESESSGTDTVSTLPGDSVVERLENKRFSSDREVPSEFVNPAPIADGAEADGADESSLGDLGFSLPSFPSE